jgi:dethiobiotin synthase
MSSAHAPRFFVTGTDTDVGKTRVTAGLAAALARSRAVRIVKPVQTGVTAREIGDAQAAAALAGCAASECLRFRRPADPWSAALAEGREPPTVADLVRRIDMFSETLVIEGAGGIAVPLNEQETFADLAYALGARAVIVVGLRLGCISHARLTIAYLRAHAVAIEGLVFNERYEAVDDAYRSDVTRALADDAPLLGVTAFDADATRSVRAAAPLFAEL